jgi:hypothetical protein
MAKAVDLSAETLKVPPITPQAATTARSPAPAAPTRPKVELVPLQVRLPRDEVRSIKIAAAQAEQTISDYMLACFHAYKKS